MHVVDPGLVAAFQGNPDQDVGRKLETTVFLHLRRRFRALCYNANGCEVDLCNEEGTAFWNIRWSLTDPCTARREQASLALGKSRSGPAKGLPLCHEFAAELKSVIPEAQPAWRWLLEH